MLRAASFQRSSSPYFENNYGSNRNRNSSSSQHLYQRSNNRNSNSNSNSSNSADFIYQGRNKQQWATLQSKIRTRLAPVFGTKLPRVFRDFVGVEDARSSFPTLSFLWPLLPPRLPQVKYDDILFHCNAGISRSSLLRYDRYLRRGCRDLGVMPFWLLSLAHSGCQLDFFPDHPSSSELRKFAISEWIWEFLVLPPSASSYLLYAERFYNST